MIDKQIATAILQQIGHRALYMIGARGKPMIAFSNGVIFRVGKNNRRINRVKITLNSMDTYDIEYWYNAISRKTWEDKSKLIAEERGVYCDSLQDSIMRNTGLNTQL